MVDCNAPFGLLNLFIYFIIFADFRIVVDYLSKRILKDYSFDWSVNFFSSLWKNTRKEENKMKLKKTENDPQKYIYYFEIVCFFRFLFLLISYICWRRVFSFCMVLEKTREKVMGLYVHFLLSINIRVFLKFVSLFLFDSELWKHIGLSKKISSWIENKNFL